MNDPAGSSRISTLIPYLLYFYAFASCTSIAATNGALALIALLFLIDWWKTKKVGNIKKDFSLFAVIYGWKGITLMVNALTPQVYKVQKLWDKLPYLVIGKYSVTSAQLQRTLHVLFITNSLLVLYAIGQKLFHLPIIYKHLFAERMEGYFGNALHYGGYISIVFILCLSISLFYEKRFSVYLPFLVAGIMMSGSRIYFIGSIVAVLLVSYLKSWKTALSSVAFTAASLSIGSYIDPYFRERLLSIFLKSTLDIRMAYWPPAWETYKEFPVFGVGYNEFTKFLKPLAEAGIVKHAAHDHNLYLQELVEGGPIGLFLMLLTLVYFMRKYYLSFKRDKDRLFSGFSLGVSASFFILAIGGTAEVNFGTAVIWLLLTFLMGICEAYGNNLTMGRSGRPTIPHSSG